MEAGDSMPAAEVVPQIEAPAAAEEVAAVATEIPNTAQPTVVEGATAVTVEGTMQMPPGAIQMPAGMVYPAGAVAMQPYQQGDEAMSAEAMAQMGGPMGEDDDDDDDEGAAGEGPPRKKRGGHGRRKIEIEYIEDKIRRHITFSKRKAGISKKAYELSRLTGAQVLLLISSERGQIYSFATPKLQPILVNENSKQLIEQCLNAPDPMALPPAPMPLPPEMPARRWRPSTPRSCPRASRRRTSPPPATWSAAMARPSRRA